MDSFMRHTQHKKKVWESYYLTGYIEVQDNLEPKISRDDFVGGKGKIQKRDGIYKEIINLEDEIYDAIERINKDRSDESLKNLANKLTDILSQLVKEQELNLKYQNTSGEDKNKTKQRIKEDEDSSDEFLLRKKGPGGDGTNISDRTEIIRAVPDEVGEILGSKVDRQKSGIRIEFSTLPSDDRSHYGDGVITIFTSHKDFQDRKTFTSKAELGQMKITARLANYLAAVISSEYKEVFYQKKKLEPPRKIVLSEQIDFIFQFEEKMKDLVDQPLDAIGVMSN